MLLSISPTPVIEVRADPFTAMTCTMTIQPGQAEGGECFLPAGGECKVDSLHPISVAIDGSGGVGAGAQCSTLAGGVGVTVKCSNIDPATTCQASCPSDPFPTCFTPTNFPSPAPNHFKGDATVCNWSTTATLVPAKVTCTIYTR